MLPRKTPMPSLDSETLDSLSREGLRFSSGIETWEHAYVLAEQRDVAGCGSRLNDHCRGGGRQIGAQGMVVAIYTSA